MPLIRESLPLKAFLIIDQSFWFLMVVNLVWSLFNLLPIFPLDGGNVCREICTWFSPRNGVRLSAQIGAVLAGVLAAWFVMQQLFFNAFLLGFLCARLHNSDAGNRYDFRETLCFL